MPLQAVSMAVVMTLFVAACSGTGSEPKAASGKQTSQLHCVALAMYWEAKAEGDAGMLAVGQVVMNRVVHAEFPTTPCAVVKQGGERPPCQFSWWCDGKSDEPTELEHWQRANELALSLIHI